MVTNLQDENNIREELVVFLRNSDVISTSDRGVTTTTEEFDGDGSETEFTLTNTPVRNIRSITVGGVSQTFGTDYSVDYSTAKVTFNSAPSNGTNNIDIQYDYGDSDSIYPDFPRYDLSLNSYPRVAIDITSTRTEEIALGGKDTDNDYLISVYCFAEGGDATNTIVKNVREAVLNSKSDFYYLEFVTPVTTSPLNPEPNRADKIMSKVVELRSLFNIETV